MIWAGTDDGNIQITRDGGNTWTNVASNLKGVPAGSWVAQIKASRYNDGEAVAVINNYRRFDFKPYLMRTRNYGKTWEPLVKESDVFGYALSYVQDPVEPNLMFFGTEHGLYISIDGAKTWSKFNNGYPSVSTMDLVIQERESDLVIGTFGRGIWVLDDINPLRVLASKGQATVAAAKVTAIPTVTAYMVSNRSANGPANPGSATYEGENRSNGAALIKFFAKKPATPERPAGARLGGGQPTEEQMAAFRARAGAGGGGNGRFGGGRGGQRGPQATVEVMDAQGNVVRTLSVPVQDGLNVAEWRFDEDPPESEDDTEDSPNQFASRFFRGGTPALPGQYRVKITVDGASDETTVEFKMDPREEFSMDALIARRDMLRQIGVVSNEVMQLSGKVNESIQSVDKVIAALQGKRGPQYNGLRTKSNDVKKQLEELQGLIGSSGRGFFGGGGDGPTPVLSHVFTAMRSVSGSYDKPGPTQQRLLERASDQLQEVKQKVEEWYSANWEAYLDAVKEVDFSPIGGDN